MAKYAVLQNFYASKAWRSFRARLIAERSLDGGCKCERCGKIIADASKISGHHKIELTPENVYDYNISLNPDNVELICHSCHNKEHDRFGNYREKKVYIVYGCPLSGKTTFVEQNKGRNDIVLDMDRLYSAITLLDVYDKPGRLFSNVKRIYNDLLDQIKVRYGQWQNAWIIGGFPDKYQRERLADELGAELVFMECLKEEAYARLEMDEKRILIKEEYKRYIDDWFRKYTE